MKNFTRSCLFLCTALLAGCSQYATVSEVRPHYHPVREVVGIPAKIEQRIVQALTEEYPTPQVALGKYLETAEAEAQVLARNPNDEEARAAYNFAVARVFTSMQRAKLEPWAQPVRVPSASGEYTLNYVRDPKPAHYAGLYDFTPADQFDVKGSYVSERTIKPGVGAPLVATGKAERKDAAEHFTMERTYYGITALIQFSPGKRATIFFKDPLGVETVQLNGRTFPLAGDFTVPLAVMLSRENPKKMELARVFHPEKYAKTARIARLQPYDPNKTVVLVVHGLMDSPATWTVMLNHLRGDRDIREHYQFWFFSYPSGYPYPYSASLLRHQLDAIEQRYPLKHKMVLIGHSMGSMISRVMVTDSGDTLWRAAFGKTPAETKFSAETRAKLEDALIFKHRPEVGRVIFIAGPHRGADMAAGWLGRFGSRLIKAPASLLSLGNEFRKALVEDSSALQLRRLPNSVDSLAPNNRFVKTINTIPIYPGIPYHSIIGDRGKGGNKDHTKPQSSDGFVPYWSSHLEGAQSELVVPSNHSAHQNPQAIAEVSRILHLNAGLPMHKIKPVKPLHKN